MTDTTENESTDGDSGSDQTEFSKLRQMALKGANFRQEFELEYFGDTVEVLLRPLKDETYIELIENLDSVDENDLQEMMDEAEDADPEDYDEDDFDPEYIRIMRRAAVKGIDHEAMGETEDGVREILNMMVGGVSIMIGAEVMEITADIQDAQTFRRR